jgi:hypothetical protein
MVKQSYENREAVARAKLRAIYENSNAKQRQQLANTLGFKGSPRVKRDSVQRLISPKGKKRSRRITEDKFSTINRSYGQLTKPGGRFSKQDIITLDAQQKVNVTEYFKPWVRPFEKIRNRKPSPLLVINTEYRIMAYVGAIVEDQITNTYEGRSYEVYTDGKSKDFNTLVSLLQKRVDDTFRKAKGAYRILGMSFSEEGGREMIRILEDEIGVPLDLPERINGDYRVQIYSTQSTGKPGQQFEEVEL